VSTALLYFYSSPEVSGLYSQLQNLSHEMDRMKKQVGAVSEVRFCSFCRPHTYLQFCLCKYKSLRLHIACFTKTVSRPTHTRRDQNLARYSFEISKKLSIRRDKISVTVLPCLTAAFHLQPTRFSRLKTPKKFKSQLFLRFICFS
jgi:hypothetical protein